jgi:hypothetical protein
LKVIAIKRFGKAKQLQIQKKWEEIVDPTMN